MRFETLPGRAGGPAGMVGVLVLKKLRTSYGKFAWLAGALMLLALSGCGSKGTTNVVAILVSPSVATVIVTQPLTLTANISGTTDTTVSSWTCQYQTRSFDSTGKEADGTLQTCNSASGNIPANSTNTTVTFTAPSQVPDATKITGTNCTSSSQACLFVIVITATAHADTKKTAKATISLDSGIVVALNPITATVPTGEQQLFSVSLSNDLQGLGVKWLLTQGTPTASLPYPSLTSCESTCGSFQSKDKSTAIYVAPSTVPTTATLTIVATSVADTARFAIGTITIVKGGPIQFNTMSPTIAPQGATFYDIFLDAPGISSASVVTLKRKSDGSQIILNTSTNQVKVLFPIPTSSNTSPTSTGARVRLTAADLATADTYTVSVSDPAETVTTCTGTPLPSGCTAGGFFSFDVVPVRPTSVTSIPDSFPQNGAPNDFRTVVNGGYFGSNGDVANATFDGNTVIADPATSSSRQLNLLFDSSKVNAVLPGLYEMGVSRTVAPVPAQNNPSVTNVAVFPDYSTTPPALVGSAVPAGTNPSAVDIDTRLGILAVAETGSNLVQFFSVGNGSLTPIACPTSCGVHAPTGLSINQANHTVAVVSPQDQSVVVLPLPGSAGAPGVTYPLTISLANLIPGNVTPLPLPYSVGVDSDTNNAVVAYSSSANPTTAKVGFLLDLNKDSQTCFLGAAQTAPPCVHAQVTLNSGPYPQIAMLPHSHQAMVTPGGAGVLSTIDVTRPSSNLPISTISLISGLVTVTVALPSGQTLGLNPGNPGTVLIDGIPITSNKTNFNGVFSVQSVLNTNSFAYALNSTANDSATCPTDTSVPVTDPQYLTKNPCQVFFSAPNVATGVSQTTQGVAINPITRTAALADSGATGLSSVNPQIILLNSLDQSATSISFHAGCTTAATKLPCSGAPELLGTSSVAFQPYSNMLVSYNPQQSQVSISNPVTSQRTAFVCNPGGMPVSSCITNPDPNIAGQQTTFQSQITLPGTGTASVTVNGNNLTLFGGLAVDPATNQAFVVESGSGQILIVKLGTLASTTLKSAEITELQVPTVSGATIGGIAGALMPQGTLTSASDLAGVQIFGAGFDSSTQVFLDGIVMPAGNVQFINSRQLTVTIPKSFLAMPHHYAVTVTNGGGSQSNATDFFVIKAVDLTSACAAGNPAPNSVAIADQLPGQGFSPIAVVTNSGCGNVAIVDINPANATFGSLVGAKTIATGNGPAGVAVSPRFGLAVVANNTDGTASVLDLVAGKQKIAAVTVGSNPTGVAIDDGTGAALMANTGSGTVSELNLALLFGSSPATSLTATTIAVDQTPIAVAIDPDRGTNNRGLAAVTVQQLQSGALSICAIDAIDIGGPTPAKSTSASCGSITSVPTGLVFNPCPFSTATTTPDDCFATPGLFYAVSSGGNFVGAYNPDTGTISQVRVGINPTSLAINPQTGGIITVNTAGQTISIIDTISNPFRTRRTYGLGGSSQFGIAIDQFTNMMVLADQATNRLLISQVPN